MVTIERLNELLRYAPEEGAFYWKDGPRAGLRAGAMRKDGYRQVSIGGRLYLEHRLVWLLETGEWPAHNIDHINRVRHDNRFVNLRDVGQSANLQNTLLRSDNASGHKGVGFTQQGRWEARIVVNRRKTYLGRFDTFEEAVAARKAAELKYHPHRPD